MADGASNSRACNAAERRSDSYTRAYGGNAMNVNDYLEIRDLFQTKWDPAVLEVLSERPHRFLALVRRMRSAVNSEIPDRSITRSLDRLQELGFVGAAQEPVGGRDVLVYALTDSGVDIVTAYQAIILAYGQVRPPLRPT
jgi:DNA-binding HxlR family transcriptional regulator